MLSAKGTARTLAARFASSGVAKRAGGPSATTFGNPVRSANSCADVGKSTTSSGLTGWVVVQLTSTCAGAMLFLIQPMSVWQH